MWCFDHSKIKLPGCTFDSKVQEHIFFYVAEPVSKIPGKNVTWKVWFGFMQNEFLEIHHTRLASVSEKKHVFEKKLECSYMDEKVWKGYCIMSL